MKTLYCIALLISATTAFCQQATLTTANSILTQEEAACFKDYETYKQKIANFSYKSLSPEDQEIFIKKITYTQDANRVTQAVTHLAEGFCNALSSHGIEFPHPATILAATLLKMKISMQNKVVTKPHDEVSARMYIFTQLLTHEERETLSKESYTKNPDAARETVIKMGKLFAEELVKLNLIENSETAKSHRADEFTKLKLNDLAQWYAQRQSEAKE